MRLWQGWPSSHRKIATRRSQSTKRCGPPGPPSMLEARSSLCPYERFNGQKRRAQPFQNSDFQCFQQLHGLPWDCHTLENTGKTEGSWVIAVGDSYIEESLVPRTPDLYGVKVIYSVLKNGLRSEILTRRRWSQYSSVKMSNFTVV